MADPRETGKTAPQGILVTDPETLKRDRLENSCLRWARHYQGVQEAHDKVVNDGIELVWQCLVGLCTGDVGRGLNSTRILDLESLPPSIKTFIGNKEEKDYLVKLLDHGNTVTGPYELEFTDIHSSKGVDIQISVTNQARIFKVDTWGIHPAESVILHDNREHILSEVIAFLPTLVDHFKPKKEQAA